MDSELRAMVAVLVLGLGVSAGVALVASWWWRPPSADLWPAACAEACAPRPVRRYRAVDGTCEC